MGVPELIKQILVKDFHVFSDRKDRKLNHKILKRNLLISTGDDWKRLRSILSPTFSSGKMKKMYSIIRECVQEFIDILEPSAKNRQNINLNDMHGNYTMDVIARCAFATKINAYKDINNPFIVNAKKVFEFKFWKLLTILLLPVPLLKLLGFQSTSDEESNQFFFNIIRNILKHRKENPMNSKYFNDFIQLMIDADKDRNQIREESDVNEVHLMNGGKYCYILFF